MAKYIILNTVEDFNELNLRINNTLKEKIENYNAVKWCSQMYSYSLNQYACYVETTGVRGNVIMDYALTEQEKEKIEEILITNKDWFNFNEIF